jgi:hypothetical protein
MNKSSLLRNIIGATLAVVLLIPVPALGITFLGGWRFFASVPGIATTNAVDNPNNYDLTISMGQVNPPSTVTKLSVTATRDFQITSASELVRISHSFSSILRDGSINATLTIQRYGVANDPFNFPPYSFTAPGAPAPPSNPSLNDFFKQSDLMQGLYRLSLTITYTRQNNPDSFWNNSSPHVFNFRGL